MRNIAVLLSLVMVAVSGCASITRGTTEAFVIETDPPGATARLSSGETCTTPCTLTKKHRDEFTVNIEKEGYEPVDANVSHTTAGSGAAGMAGNVLLGGIIGAAIDAGTGSTQKLAPNPLAVTLLPTNTTQSVSDATISGETEPLAFVAGAETGEPLEEITLLVLATGLIGEVSEPVTEPTEVTPD
jgi:hypothetical protein